MGFLSFPGGSDGKESAYNTGDLGLIPGLGRSPGEGKRYTHSSIPAWRIPQTGTSSLTTLTSAVGRGTRGWINHQWLRI